MDTSADTVISEVSEESFDEQYFKRLLSSANRTLSKVRKIDIEELMELAWVDGMAQPFADRLARSRPELKGDIERALVDLKS
jgi:hypothetical protein